MDRKTFERTLEWCVYYEDICGTQNELSLTGLGETLMHPDFLEYATLAREALPHNFINLSTNGLLLTEKICEHLAKLNIRLYISMHRPEKAGPAIQKAKKYGILNDTNDSFATSAFDWGGQVDWYVSAPEKTPCEWLRSGWANVLVDGRITACCLDAAAAGVFAHVDDEIGEAYTKPFDLCSTCHMSVP